MKNSDRQLEPETRYGWQSTLPGFVSASTEEILGRLFVFPGDSGVQQSQAWRTSITWLKGAYDNLIREDRGSYDNSTVLEYELPRDFRRPDIIVLRGGAVIVLESKGRVGSSQAALDQVQAYARDLRAYHAACADRPVIPVLVPSNGPEEPKVIDGIHVVGPTGVERLLGKIESNSNTACVDLAEFLKADAYAPLPTIVQAARDLYHERELPYIKRARAATEPAIDCISQISHQAAGNGSRELVLVSGVPGAGKTLVGLQVVHAGWLDDLAVERQTGRKGNAAVYLSGNGPLVAVLQDALQGEATPGSVFVQDIKKYVSYYSRANRIPPEHVIVFDEAQRAHDADRVAQVHKTEIGHSEPDHLIAFCGRIPKWSALVGLIGTGQAIHVGEEGGMALWRDALVNSEDPSAWTVHAAPEFESFFADAGLKFEGHQALNLDTEIRFHLAPRLDEFVEGLVSGQDSQHLCQIANELYEDGFRYLITRDLEQAKQYVRDRYADAPSARYGILASSKDKWLLDFNVDNSFQTTKRLKVGPWYNRPQDDLLSCCQLDTVATEFSSQGLELDFVILGWGSDLLWKDGKWSMTHSRGSKGVVHDPMQLRKNVYRVLLTRGRDGTVVFLPSDDRFNETYDQLVESGFKPLAYAEMP